MNPTEEETKKVIRVSKKKFIGFIVLLIIPGLFLVVINFLTSSASLSTTSIASIPSIPSLGGMMDYYPTNPPIYQGGSSIRDTREFLKTSYSATIKTRDVSGVVTEVKNIVKGADGRIDNISSSEKNGYVSFVVEKSKFDAFRNEIEAITHQKLYAENISSQNLLGQKQGIEVQKKNIETSLADLQKQEADLVAKHTQTLTVLTKNLTDAVNELAFHRRKVAVAMSTTTDNQTMALLLNLENKLVQKESVQRQNIAQENASYEALRQNLESNIASSKTSLVDNTKQDVAFADNVETVNGSVSVRWVSYWEIADIYSPISPTIIIIVFVIGLWVYLKRKGVIPSLVLV